MKRQILACFYVCVASALFARDAVIEKVEAFERGDKTSVVIAYSGVEALRFFALDATDGVFSLDLPGVYSRFDFNTLAFAQVSEVRQLPLDPDANSGISVRFFLNPEVTYHVFASGDKTLTVMFQGGAPATVAQSAPEAAPATSTAPATLSGAAFQQVVTGVAGDRKLSKLTLEANATAGKLTMAVDKLDRFTHFFLDSPKRFVVDLRGTLLSLDQTDLVIDHPLVKQIRVRQFQSHPEAITRVVLDLNSDAQVRVNESKGGLEIAFADSSQTLATLMEQGFAQVKDAVMAEVANDRSDVLEPQAESGTFTSELDEVAPELAEAQTQLAEQVQETEQVEAPDSETAVANTPTESVELVDAPTVVAEAPRQAVEDPQAEQGTSVAVEADSQPGASAAETAEELAPVSASPTSVADAAPIAVAEQVALAEEASVAAQEPAQEPKVETQPVQVATSEPVGGSDTVTAVNEPLVAANESLNAVFENEPAPIASVTEVLPVPVQAKHVKPIQVANNKASKADPDQEMANFLSEEPRKAQKAEVAAKPVTAAPTQVAKSVEVKSPSKAPEPVSVVSEDVKADAVAAVSHDEPVALDESSGKAGKSSFVMASDEDLEMDQIIESSKPNSTLYDQMRGVKSNLRNRGPVVVTNNRIATKKLVETSNMQDGGSGSGDFAELFREEKGTIQSVGTEEPEYRGFEIMIDIREQPVVDLLRFLADEVGFNLFVDSSVGAVRATYKFHNIPWDQALDIILTNADLDKEFRNGVLRVATTAKFQREEQDRLRLRMQRELSVPTETVTVELNYARASDMLTIVDEYLSPRGSIIVDDRTNTMIIRDIPKYMVEIRTLINRLDKRIPQVSIEARIVETTTRFLRELGVQWGLTAQYSPENGTNTGLDFPHRLNLGGPRIGQPRSRVTGPEGGYAVNLPVVSSNAVGMGLTLGNFLDNFKLDISMQMLETEGQGQVISSPKITTQNNKQAVITNGQRVPIQTLQRGTVSSRYVNAALELQVRPQITADETVIMNLIIEKSELDFSITVLGNPVINTRRAETQVLVKNGGTAVIGGIFTLNEQNFNDGLPVLRKMPVLRRVFGHDRKQLTNQELLIFVTPKIVKY